MGLIKSIHVRLSVMILLIFLCIESKAKFSENKTNEDSSEEVKFSPKKVGRTLSFVNYVVISIIKILSVF